MKDGVACHYRWPASLIDWQLIMVVESPTSQSPVYRLQWSGELLKYSIFVTVLPSMQQCHVEDGQ